MRSTSQMVDRISISWYNKAVMTESFKRERPDGESDPTSSIDYIERLGGDAPEKRGIVGRSTAEDTKEDSYSSIDFIERMGEETPEKEKKVAKRVGGIPASAWGWAAGGIAAGGVLTIGRALEYALMGWELDSNGWPKIDKQSMAHVDKWHNKVAGIKG